MKRPGMIYFYGPDGSGKTTHAVIVLHVLRKWGLPAVYTNLKLHHTLSYLVLRVLLRQGRREWYIGFSEPLRTRIRRPLKALEVLSILPALVFRVVVFRLLGYTIVCDRYVVDTLVTLSAFLGDKSILKNWFARALMKTIPKSSLLIHLDSEVSTILSRKKDEPLTENLISYYRRVYTAFTRYLNEIGFKVLVVNTSCGQVNVIARKYLKTLHHLI